MELTHLIQRLRRPQPPREVDGRKIDNPFAFGGGMRNGGLTDEAMDLLRPIFSFDYMGSAEFEGGNLPKALSKMAENRKDMQRWEVLISKKKVNRSNIRKGEKFVDGTDAVVYVFGNINERVDIDNRITDLVVNGDGSAFVKPRESGVWLKSHTNLTRSLLVEDPDNPIAWLELDNSFFFSVSGDTRDQFAAIFAPAKEEENKA